MTASPLLTTTKPKETTRKARGQRLTVTLTATPEQLQAGMLALAALGMRMSGEQVGVKDDRDPALADGQHIVVVL